MVRSIPDKIIERAEQGCATKKDALELLDVDPFELFKLADGLREAAVSDTVTYVVNHNINFTDTCIGDCGFCAFKNRKGYFLDIDDILEKVDEADRAGATEVCIQGGLRNDVDINYYQNILESIHSKYPHIHIHAFSPMEVFHASRLSGISEKETLARFKGSGIGTMPGTAAEILSDRVRSIICPSKINSEDWVRIITLAHQNRIPTTATIMYGHVETWEERIDHILTVRGIQEQTGGFTEFVPLPFMPYNNPLGEQMIRSGRYATSGIEDLQVHALARILLNTHIDNIQTSWVKLGKKIAQVALTCGANDLGGTLMEESISKSAGASNGESISVDELEWIIGQTSRTPMQRDTLYRPVKK
ncbi:MAG: 5-amino-6-(D-ribitylamino)uracil--L-tyrosine 4-hydroxyphenyl transferase CofH [Methanosarcinaceae archaeon]